MKSVLKVSMSAVHFKRFFLFVYFRFFFYLYQEFYFRFTLNFNYMSNTIVVYGKTAFHFNYLNTYEHNEQKKKGI